MFISTFQGAQFSWGTGYNVVLTSGAGGPSDQWLQFGCPTLTSTPTLDYTGLDGVPIAGTIITCSAWLNSSSLTGHPTDGHNWTTGVGIVFNLYDGSQSFVTAATIPAGQTWTKVSGTVTVPANAKTMAAYLALDMAAASEAPSLYSLAAGITYAVGFNGYTIIPMPTTAVPMQLDMEITDSVGVVQSPFTLQSQFQQWPGAEQWTCNVGLPPVTRGTSDSWISWYMALQGILNTFFMGDFSHTVPTGTALGTPLVDGTSLGYNLPTSYYLHTKGWTANQPAVLNPGDYLQIGVRLHRIAGFVPVNSDQTGNAVIPIWPAIREQPADNQLVILNHARGLWRLADNKRVWTERPTKVLGLSFKASEAR